ncbi:MAG: hypothetical protein ACO38R_01810, partial [Ilumatobacteraceae bacterium]
TGMIWSTPFVTEYESQYGTHLSNQQSLDQVMRFCFHQQLLFSIDVVKFHLPFEEHWYERFQQHQSDEHN